MSNGDRLLQEWSNPIFITAPRRSRELYLFLVTACPAASPLGLIWYYGDKQLGVLARKAQVSIISDAPALVDAGLAKHDPESGIIYLPHALSGGLIKTYTARNINSWRRRFDAMPSSPIKEVWRLQLVSQVSEYPKGLATKIAQNFASADELAQMPGGKTASPEALELVQYFADKFAEKGNGTYVGNWSREVQVAKELLEVINFEDIKHRIDLYFKDEWLCRKASLDFMSFRRNINKFAKSSKSAQGSNDLSGYWDIVNKGAL